MAVSQGWSGWAGGRFDRKGKILQFIATRRRHLWVTAQNEVKNSAAAHPQPLEGKNSVS
jgi:hypothetical protein